MRKSRREGSQVGTCCISMKTSSDWGMPMGNGGGGVEEWRDQGWEGELSGDDARLVVGAHKDGKEDVEDCPCAPEDVGECG